MKKLLSILLAALMAFSAFSVMPFSAFAASPEELENGASGKCGDNIGWHFLGNQLTLTGSGDMPNYGSGASPFFNKTNIYTIKFQGNITSIGDTVFSNVSNLKSITIPSSVTKIGKHSFSYCSSLENVVIPDSVESIGMYAFHACTKLKSVTLSKNLKEIPKGAFIFCENLTGVVIPNGVESIPDSAFRNCESLKTVIIPESVTSIAESAFYGAVIETVIYLSTPEKAAAIDINIYGNDAIRDAKWYCDGGQCGDNVYYGYRLNGEKLLLAGTGATWDYTYDILADPDCGSPFYENRNIKTIIVGDGITGLGNNLFNSCYDVTSLTLPDGLTSIGEWALQYLSNLQSLDLPSTVTSIGEGAFNALLSLKNITIPEGVTSIEKNTFMYCYDLERLVLPQNITVVEEGAFNNAGIKDLFVKSGVDISNAEVSDDANVWRYEVIKTASESADGKTHVKIVSRDQGTATTVPCNMNDDRYLVDSVEVSGVTLTHNYDENKICTNCKYVEPITEINSIEDFKTFTAQVNSGYDYEGKTVTLKAKLDFEQAGDMEPIGKDASHPFNGTFDGIGEHLWYFNMSEDYGGDYAGLFGYVGANGTVKNVELYYSNLYGKNNSGIIVGKNSGTVKHCVSEACNIKGNDNVGGVVGYNEGNVSYCFSKGSVTGNDYVGGVVGLNKYKITNSFNRSAVTGHFYVGGIAGKNHADGGDKAIRTCYNIGTINATKTAGGIAGENSGTVSGCYNVGYVSAGSVFGALTGNEEGNLAWCYYDNELWPDAKAVGSGEHSNNNVTALTTAQMTGKNAAKNMWDKNGWSLYTEKNAWLSKNDTGDSWFYPHLKGFDYRCYEEGGYNRQYVPRSDNSMEMSSDDILIGYWPADLTVETVYDGSDKLTYNSGNQLPAIKYVRVYDDFGWIGYSDLDAYSYQKYENGTWISVDKDDTITPGAYKKSCSYNGVIRYRFCHVLTPQTDYTVGAGAYYTGEPLDETVNVGKYSALIVFTETGFGYDHNAIKKGFEITKKDLKITAKDRNYTYNGTAQGEDNKTYTTDLDSKVEVSGLEGNDALTSIKLNGQETNADEYDGKIVASAAEIGEKTGNYNIGYTAGKLTINPKPITITVNGNSKEVTYNGGEQTFNGTFTPTSSDTMFDASKFSYSGSTSVSGTNVDTYTLTPVEGNAAYNDNNFTASFVAGDPVKLIIKKANANVTVVGNNNTSEYDEKEHVVTDYVATSDNDLYDVTKFFTFSGIAEAKRTEVGTTAMGLDKNQFTNINNNFNVAFNVTDGYQKIEAQPMDEKALDVTLDEITYDGTAKDPVVKVGDTVLEKDKDYTITYTDSDGNAVTEINGAGEYTVTITGIGNYSGEVTKTVTVEPKAVTITAEDKKSNLGDELKELTYKVDGAVAGDELNVKLSTTADANVAGEYDITVTAANANYTITLVNGTYTVADKILESEKAEAETAINAETKGTSSAKAVTIYWGKVKKADKIVVYAAYCGKNRYKKIATLRGDATKYDIAKLNGKALNQKKNVKAYVVAYRTVNGKDKKIAKSLKLHVAGYKSKRTNTKAIKLKKSKFTLAKGKTAKIKGRVILENKKKKAVNHVRKLRFRTSNKKVATVSKSGKITAKGKGTCTIYVFANNGMAKKVKVTVK